MSIRIGIAGCGAHALNRIVPLLVDSTTFQLVAACTRNPQTKSALRERGVEYAVSDFARFLAADMDVVYVASVSGLHHAHAAAVLQSGRHAWVEKPLACTAAEARELVSLAERSELMLAETFMFAWHPQATLVRQALTQALPGEPRVLALTFCFPHLPADNFRYDRARGGGAWLDHGCYLVKALDHYFPGEWQLLGGCLEHEDYAVDVRGAAQLRRAHDGLVANLTWGFGQGYVNELQVIGTRGRMLVESAFTKPGTRSCDIVLEDSTGQRSRFSPECANGFGCMFDGLARQLAEPVCWAGLRQDVLAHAEQFFALQTQLQCATPPTSPRTPSHAE